MRKICLLGGSNSVLKNSFNSGLCSVLDIQLAIGASSSLQNMHALIANKKEVRSCDVIVTESNVNDAYNINNVGYDKEVIINNIHHLYDELYRTGKEVVSILIPVKQYSSEVSSKELVDEVNSIHKDLVSKYGFQLVDLDSHFSSLKRDCIETKYIQPDALHPINSFMYSLGFNLRNMVLSEKFNVNSRREYESNYFVFDEFIERCEGEKENSKYTRKYCEVDGKIEFSVSDGFLVGVETWSDGMSQLIFEDEEGRSVVKAFNSNLAFNEFIAAGFSKFSLRSNVGKFVEVVEPSVNVRRCDEVLCHVKLTSLLFRKMDRVEIDMECVVGAVSDMSFVIPPVEPYLSGIERFVKKNNYQINNDSDAKYLRDSAVALEDRNLELSLKLMKKALAVRPDGPFIRKKVEEYKVRLTCKSSNKA